MDLTKRIPSATLAILMGVTRQRANKILRGKVKGLRAETCQKISDLTHRLHKRHWIETWELNPNLFTPPHEFGESVKMGSEPKETP